jgi:hypothetical protein
VLEITSRQGGYEFFYEGWKEDNPTRENCRFGANREDLFPADRNVTLDVTFLKNMGLYKQPKEYELIPEY